MCTELIIIIIIPLLTFHLFVISLQSIKCCLEIQLTMSWYCRENKTQKIEWDNKKREEPRANYLSSPRCLNQFLPRLHYSSNAWCKTKQWNWNLVPETLSAWAWPERLPRQSGESDGASCVDSLCMFTYGLRVTVICPIVWLKQPEGTLSCQSSNTVPRASTNRSCCSRKEDTC